MSAWRALGAVASGMIGIRRGAQAAKDWSDLKPWHIAVAALFLVGSFVIVLIVLVNYLTP